MSVINRMLRDLDQRQQQERKDGFTPAAAAPGGFPWAWLLGIFVVVAIAVVAVMAIYHSMNAADPELREQSAPAPIKVAELEPTPKATALVESVAENKPAPEAVQPQQQLAPQPVVKTAEPQSQTAQQPEPEPQAELQPMQPEQVEQALPDLKPDDTGGTMNVTRVEISAAELAEVKLKQAREALQNGERERAGSLLEQVIALAPDHVDARSELAAYWYGRGRVASALAVLEQGLQRQPQQPRWLTLYARILLENGAYQQLLTALTMLPENTSEASDLLRMRATAANELGRHGQAATDYQSLGERTQQGRWWLAAAVAFEDAEQPQAALTSYQRALADANLSQDAKRYAMQRLNALGGQ